MIEGRWMYLNFSGFWWCPLHQRHPPAEHEHREPLQTTQRTTKHEDGTQSRTRDLQLIRHLTHSGQSHHLSVTHTRAALTTFTVTRQSYECKKNMGRDLIWIGID